jgi:exosortase
VTPRRGMGLALAVLAAGFIWLRNLAWAEESADTLSVLAGVLLYVWFSRPWQWHATTGPLPLGRLGLGLGLFLTGSVVDSTVLLALGWCLAWQAWITPELTERAPAAGLRLIALLFCSFPWVALGGQQIGWWFRYSGAAVTEHFFRLVGFAVERQGTFLLVQGQALAVDPACAGLNVLQAMLLAGVALAHLQLPQPRRFWIGLAALAPLAWLANTARIITLGVAGLTFGADTARGWFHNWGGWTVLCFMFVLTYGFFAALGRTGVRRQ